MIDTTDVAREIRHLISTGAEGNKLLAVVSAHYPGLTSAELSQALQDATAAAERQATRRH